jgi:hypothetical protein
MIYVTALKIKTNNNKKGVQLRRILKSSLGRSFGVFFLAEGKKINFFAIKHDSSID